MEVDQPDSGPSRPRIDSTPPRNSEAALKKTSSRIGSALARVRSTDAHPPHHAHFDIPTDPPPIPRPSRAHNATKEAGASANMDRELGVDVEQGPDGDGDETEKERDVPAPVIDIEHMPCDDDPRKWSYLKKHFVLAMVTFAFVSVCLPARSCRVFASALMVLGMRTVLTLFSLAHYSPLVSTIQSSNRSRMS